MERLAISVLIVSGCFYIASGQSAGYVNDKPNADSIVNNYLRNCDFDRALQFANQSRKQALFDDKDNTGWMLKTCEIYLAQGDIDAGKEMLEEAGQIIQRLKDPGHLLQFQYALQKGRYFHFVSRNVESLQWLRRAEFHAKYLEKYYSGDISRLYGELGSIQFQLTQYPASVRYYQLAIETHPGNLPIDLNEVTCFKAKMANACWLNHEKSKSILLIRSCIEYLDTLENPLHPSLLEAYLILDGYQLSFYELFPITKDLLRNATIILDKSFPSDHFLAGMLYTEKAENEYTRTDFENALQYSKRALQIVSKYKFLDQYKQLNYQTMAQAYFWLERDYQKTIIFCKQAIDSLQGTGLSPAYLYYMIGLSYSMLQNKSLAVENLNRVISLASDNKKYPDSYDCSIAYQELGSIFSRENKHEIVRSYLLKSLAFAKRISEKGYRINSIDRELGNSYRRLQEGTCISSTIHNRRM
jgi:tetratricopeptide (TPR) repeat protein